MGGSGRNRALRKPDYDRKTDWNMNYAVRNDCVTMMQRAQARIGMKKQ